MLVCGVCAGVSLNINPFIRVCGVCARVSLNINSFRLVCGVCAGVSLNIDLIHACLWCLCRGVVKH